MTDRKKTFLISALIGLAAAALHFTEGYAFFFRERIYYTDNGICCFVGVALPLLWWWICTRRAGKQNVQFSAQKGTPALLYGICCLLLAVCQVFLGIRFLSHMLSAGQPLLHAAVGITAFLCAVSMVYYVTDLLPTVQHSRPFSACPPFFACLPSLWFGLCLIDVFAEYSTACPKEENLWQIGCCIVGALVFLYLGELRYGKMPLPAKKVTAFLPGTLFCISSNLPCLILRLLGRAQPSAFPAELQLVYLLAGLVGVCAYFLLVPAPAEEKPPEAPPADDDKDDKKESAEKTD